MCPALPRLHINDVTVIPLCPILSATEVVPNNSMALWYAKGAVDAAARLDTVLEHTLRPYRIL
jgi:hypothetical protein